jgi:non-specific serine/threonine protein kinase/serine/threonine-protein kinase
MDHPNIARFYDGGATESGRPYFVMELVQGIALTDYCDTHRLTTEERLRLFIDVCHAVQHAHHKGVIHRDLKPSNVLVTVKDNRPVVKIIDFGIAKALGHGLTDQTLVTRIGQVIGTPEYMSPEQAEMSGMDVDTRTDLYSLGVMLYELLVGARPFDLKSRVEQAIGYEIRETEVPRPSTRLTSLGDTQKTIADHRSTTAEALRKELRSDLDWIILKAMEKDRTRRYDTANGFAQELERHLRHEPVLARAPTVGYRVGKFVKRHRLGVAAGAAVVAALVAGLSLATMGMVRAQRAERRAEAEAEAARQVSEFLVDIFEVSDPSEARGNTVTAREILDQGAQRVEEDLAGQGLLQARLMLTMGEVYRGLGLYPDARELIDEAIDLRIAEMGPSHSDVADAIVHRGMVQEQQGDLEGAAASFTEALSIYEGIEPRDGSAIATTLTNLGGTLSRQAQYGEALEILERALAVKESNLGTAHPDVASTLYNLGVLHRREERYDTAGALLSRALGIRETALGSDHPSVARTLNSLAIIYTLQEKTDSAETLYRRSLAQKEQTLGPDHPDVANTVDNLAILFARQSQFEEAIPLFERALTIRLGALSADHISIGQSHNNLGLAYRGAGRLPESEAAFQKALEVYRAALSPTHPQLAGTLENYAALLRLLQREGEAEEMEAEAERVRRAGEGG